MPSFLDYLFTGISRALEVAVALERSAVAYLRVAVEVAAENVAEVAVVAEAENVVEVVDVDQAPVMEIEH